MKQIAAITLLLIFGITAWAGQDPLPTPKDHRIRVVPYSENDVVQVLTHYGYVTTVEYAPDEIIQDWPSGDPMAYQIIPNKNTLKIRPLLNDATTNLTVYTNYRRYYYELKAADVNNPRAKELTFNIRYTYSSEDNMAAAKRQSQYLREAQDRIDQRAADQHGGIRPEDLYFGYTFKGDPEITPVQIYDDSKFTYFLFREKSKLPSIYTVDNNRNEALVNYHMEGKYIVVQQMAGRFTLRSEQKVVSVFRETLPGMESVDRSDNGINQNRNMRGNSKGGSYADW